MIIAGGKRSTKEQGNRWGNYTQISFYEKRIYVQYEGEILLIMEALSEVLSVESEGQLEGALSSLTEEPRSVLSTHMAVYHHP